MVILNASATIAGNVITGNRAVCGIEIGGGSAVIQGNIITREYAGSVSKKRGNLGKNGLFVPPTCTSIPTGSRSEENTVNRLTAHFFLQEIT